MTASGDPVLGGRFPGVTRLVILVDGYRRWNWLKDAAWRRLVEELAKLDVQLNQDKTRHDDWT